MMWGPVMMSRRDSEHAARVLDALARHGWKHDGWMYGLDIAKASGLFAGSFYPTLLRLEQAGWIESRWEDDAAPYPRRRQYRVKPR
jgi:DNA-binding IclR family transcriptional regulator